MKRLKALLCVSVFSGLVSVAIAKQPSKPQLPATVVFDNEYQSAGSCQDTGREVNIKIPNADQLDLSVVDPTWHIPGITFRPTTSVGTSGIRNVSVNGDTLHYQIFAGGGGTYQGWPYNGCVGGSGGSYGVEVTAHYKQRAVPTRPHQPKQ